MAFDFSMMLPQGGIMNPGSEGMSPEQNKMMMLGLLSNAFTNIGNLGAGRPQESFMPGLLSMQTMFNNQNQKAGKAKKLQEAFKGATVNDPVAGYGVGGNWSQDPATAQFMAQQAQDINALGGQEAPSIMPEVKPYGPPRLDMSKAMQNLMNSGDPDLMMAGFENQLKMAPEAIKPQLVTVYGEDGRPMQKWVRPGESTGVDVGMGKPETGSQSTVGQLIAEMNRLPPNDPMRGVYQNAIDKQTTHAPAAQMNNYGSPVAGVDASGNQVFFQPSKGGGAPSIVQGVAPMPPKPVPPTGEENTAAGYLGRMQAAERLVSGLAGGEATLGTNAAASIPLIGSYAQQKAMSTKQQQYKQAADDWIRAKLRKESGAVIAPAEMQQEYETYFPIPGNDPATIKQKAMARRQAEEQMIQSAGRAAPQQTQVPFSKSEMDYIAKRRGAGVPDQEIALELQHGAANAPAAKAKPVAAFDLPPNAKKYEGKTLRDTKSGKRFKSVGGKWVEVK